ncbi:DUF5590 domain-containing protein [Paenibacillus sp. GCM10027626]|uniref:cell wall elongation regulator TseB-like domain-containing protein n=1 Tax=Paenibacillus sp. GCM10027626 TaxID=3273411 RepID=UPI00363FE42E
MRITRYRRTPVLTPWRITLIIAAAIIIALIALNQYYRYVQRPFWDEQAVAETKVKEAGLLQETDRAVKYVWDNTVWIVHGKDADGDEAYAWMPEDGESSVFKLKEGVSKQRLEDALAKSRADAKIEHIKLGYKDGEPAWEVFYTKKASGNYFYDFFRFSDGALLVTYTLPQQ